MSAGRGCTRRQEQVFGQGRLIHVQRARARPALVFRRGVWQGVVPGQPLGVRTAEKSFQDAVHRSSGVG